MKKIIYACFALLLFTQCNSEKTELSTHFHTCASENDGTFEARILLPDLLNGERVYLSKVDYENDFKPAPEGTPNAGRMELRLTQLDFSTNENDQIMAMGDDNITFNKDCNELIITSKKSKEELNKVEVASIGVSINGETKEVEFPRKPGKYNNECYKPYDNCKSNGTKTLKGGILLFHPGHVIGNPMPGFDGISIPDNG